MAPEVPQAGRLDLAGGVGSGGARGAVLYYSADGQLGPIRALGLGRVMQFGSRQRVVAVGSLLCGKWRLKRAIGAGGMSTVYEAEHRNGKRVAIKVLHQHLAHLPRAKERFLREALLVNRVQHAGVVSVLDDDVASDGSVFLVMDLLEGETLASRVARSGPFSDWCELLPILSRCWTCSWRPTPRESFTAI